MTRQTARYGWRPDLPDHRDTLFHEVYEIIDELHLPSKVDLSPHMPPIWDQGNLGSCTGHGIARVLAYEALRQGEPLEVSATNAGYSRLFIYYGEREIEGSTSQDSGGQIRDGIKIVAADGAPFEADWPYSDANPGPFQQKPPSEVYTEAEDHKAIRYSRIVPGTPGAPLRSALAQGLPIVFGFSVPQSFEDGSWDPSSEVLPLPGPNEGFIGGHCVVITGYDWTRERFPVPAFQIDNSWSESWGMNGRFWMAWDWFTPRYGLASDLWTISRVE